MKKIIFILILIIFSITPVFSEENNNILPSEIGEVLSIETFGNLKPFSSGELQQIKQSVEVRVVKGDHAGAKTIVENVLMGNPAYDIKLKKGDRVVLHVEQSERGDVNYFIADKQRVNTLFVLAGIFFILLLFVGQKKGFSSLISILITLALIFWGLTPLILSGMNPVFAAILVCIFSSVIAIYLVGGFNAKSTSAILGTILSLAIAGVLSVLSIKLAGLTGFSSEESMFLYVAHPGLNFVGILASAMIIGALGAVMDIGMSISSTINELFVSNSKMGGSDLFVSGMNVGKDIIGTMANTLILAYLGGALSLVLLSSNIDMQKFFNLNQVATEISAALIGSIAIVLCVPITAIIAAYLIRKFPSKEVEENDFDDIMEKDS